MGQQTPWKEIRLQALLLLLLFCHLPGKKLLAAGSLDVQVIIGAEERSAPLLSKKKKRQNQCKSHYLMLKLNSL